MAEVNLEKRYSVNEAGHMTIAGMDGVELVKKFGSPLYVLDEQAIRDRCRAYVTGFDGYEAGSTVIFAGKALLTQAVCRIIEDEGLALDVVSGGELYTALSADFPAQRIFFHGNNKSVDELKMALKSGIHRIIVDNTYELELLNDLAGELKVNQPILLRLTPGVEVDTHAHIQTGQDDSKFGFGLETDALESSKRALNLPHVTLKGFHFHIGSQLMEETPFLETVDVAFGFLDRLRKDLGYTADELNLGGGVGIRYVKEDRPMDPTLFIRKLTARVKSVAAQMDYPLPHLMVEPGRSIVGEAGVTLYSVGSIKQVSSGRTYVAVDGGMADNPRVALYDAVYEAVVVNKATQPAEESVTITGKCCESGDMLLFDFAAPKIESGDIIAVLSTGAYNYSMASHYNRLPKPAMVLVHAGGADIIVQRETYADIVRQDVIPERLQKGE